MRLEEWYQHLESFDHSGDQAVTVPVRRSAIVQPVLESPPGRPVALEENRFEGSAAATQFRPAPASRNQQVAPERTARPDRGRPSPPQPLPVQKESRDQLLARLLDPILTLEEAAQVLNVCPTTVRRYTNKGLLQHYRTTGNQRRFRLSHVLNFLGECGGGIDEGTLTETLDDRTHGRVVRVRPRTKK